VQGTKSGVGNIVAGAVGGAGVAVMMPVMGLAAGMQNAGIVGGLFGLVGGAVVGVLGAAALVVGGAVMGVTQIARGLFAAPEAAMAPHQGKWWNENEGKWIYTDMEKEIEATLKGVPDDDSDILGDIQKDLDASAELGSGKGGEVIDAFYYETLEVATDADDSTIRRRYYLLAKKYHPDRNPDDKEAADKFKMIAEAYQVLSDPELRARYNKDGREGLSADKTSVADGGMPKVDPYILFAFLFGSDKFNDYVGRLASATSASVGDSQKVSLSDARKLQKRRVVRLTQKLITKISVWIEAKQSGADGIDEPSSALEDVETYWKKEAAELSKASYGYQLVTTLGKIYNLMAIQYQGSMNSGQGLPSVSKWAERQHASMEKQAYSNKNKMQMLKAGLEMVKMQKELQVKMEQATTEEEKANLARQLEENALTTLLLVLWTNTVVDISSTIYEVTHMAFFDQSVDKETRMARSEAVKVLGQIWMDVPEPASKSDEEKDAKKLYEEAAFAAMLETVKRKDAATAGSS